MVIKLYDTEAELQEQLEAKEEQLSAQYASLGKKYYETHKQDKDPELSSEIEAVESCEDEITKLREHLRKIKDGLICKKCGSEINKNDRFCPSCGGKIIRESEENGSPVCPRCGDEVSHGQKFCVKCGYSLLEIPAEDIIEEAPEQEQPQNIPTIETVPEPAVLPIKCPACGAPVEDDARFCIFCGHNLE